MLRNYIRFHFMWHHAGLSITQRLFSFFFAIFQKCWGLGSWIQIAAFRFLNYSNSPGLQGLSPHPTILLSHPQVLAAQPHLSMSEAIPLHINRLVNDVANSSTNVTLPL